MFSSIRNIYKLNSSVVRHLKKPQHNLNNFYFTNTILRANENVSDEVAKSRIASEEPIENTIFDKIISKEIKADIIYEDEKCLVFNDISPQAPVHFLVIPKERIGKLDSCTENDSTILAHLMLTAKNIAKEKLPNGYRLVINNGKHGAQSVYHLHIHILGGRQMNWPPG